MSDLVWRLPGVQSYIQRVMENVDSGTSVILHCPPNAPEELLGALEDRCNEDYRHLHWISLNASDLDCSSPVSLANSISLADVGEDAGIASVDALAAQGQQRVYAIEKFSTEDWPQFAEFLKRFRAASHQRDEHDRDVFLVVADGAFSVPDFDVGLRTIPWHNVVREIDSRLLLDLIETKSNLSGLELTLKASIAAELGGADLGLVEKLAEQSLETLLSPMDFLRDFAGMCGWCSSDCQNWSDGGTEHFRGGSRFHSAVATLTNDEQEIRKRVWHGQLTVVFPYLEERRLGLLPKLSPFLKGADLRDYQGMKAQLEDLELGSLHHFIRNASAPDHLKQEVRLLRSLRHELAHLRPIDASLMRQLLRYATRSTT